jgi:hypothetical protein
VVPDFDLPLGCTALVTRFAASRASVLLGLSGVDVIELGREGTAAQASDALAVSDNGRHDGDNAGDSRGEEPRTVVVGDPHAWQSAWPVFSALRSRGTVVFDGCTVADVRGLQHDRELPPLIDGDDRVWFAAAGSALARARWTLPADVLAMADAPSRGAAA